MAAMTGAAPTELGTRKISTLLRQYALIEEHYFGIHSKSSYDRDPLLLTA